MQQRVTKLRRGRVADKAALAEGRRQVNLGRMRDGGQASCRFHGGARRGEKRGEVDLAAVYQTGKREFPLETAYDELENLNSVGAQPKTSHSTHEAGNRSQVAIRIGVGHQSARDHIGVARDAIAGASEGCRVI